MPIVEFLTDCPHGKKGERRDVDMVRAVRYVTDGLADVLEEPTDRVPVIDDTADDAVEELLRAATDSQEPVRRRRGRPPKNREV